MSFTFTRAGNSVVLPSPDFGDNYTIDPQVLIRQSRVNEPTVYKSDDWPIQKSHRYSFSGLKNTEREDIKGFLAETTGGLIDFTDHNAVNFQGFVTNNIIQFITNRDTNLHSFTIDVMIKE